MLQYRPVNVDLLPEKTVELIKENPLPPLNELVPPAPVGESFYMSAGDLIDIRDVEPFDQRPILLNHVLKILTGTTVSGSKANGNVFPLIHTKRLFQPITVGFNSFGEPVGILGGRNRWTAILTGKKIQGVDIDSAEFRSELIRVIPEEWDVRTVQALNNSRAMQAPENLDIKVQTKYPDVDVNDVESIVNGFYDKEVKLNLSESMFLAVRALYRDLGTGLAAAAGVDVTDDTLKKIVASTVAKLNESYKKLMKWVPNQPDLFRKLVAMISTNVPQAVAQYTAEGGTTSAREYAKVVSILLPMVVKFEIEPFQKAAALAEANKPTAKATTVKTIKASAEAKVAKAAAPKEPRKPRARKTADGAVHPVAQA